ncbi:MAG: hypothetical protein HXY28_11490 [Hydrogenophilaceae bacterium]|nr:hypothetical protein [Hydrogenophilaceae bacterium]
MSQEELLVTLASGAAVLALIFIAWALGFRDAARLDGEDDVRRALAAYEPGAVIEACFIDARGRGALAQLSDGRYGAVRAMADGFAVRTFRAGAARVKTRRGRLVAAFADVGFPRLEVRFEGAAPAWLAPLMEERS